MSTTPKKEKCKVHFIVNQGVPLLAGKVNRNDPCPCGSGKKSKYCCNTPTKYFLSKAPNTGTKSIKLKKEAR